MKVKSIGKDEKTIHLIHMGQGNITACGIPFKNILGKWTILFTINSHEVNCPFCLEDAKYGLK
jgi:hypothetical protein